MYSLLHGRRRQRQQVAPASTTSLKTLSPQRRRKIRCLDSAFNSAFNRTKSPQELLILAGFFSSERACKARLYNRLYKLGRLSAKICAAANCHGVRTCPRVRQRAKPVQNSQSMEIDNPENTRSKSRFSEGKSQITFQVSSFCRQIASTSLYRVLE